MAWRVLGKRGWSRSGVRCPERARTGLLFGESSCVFRLSTISSPSGGNDSHVWRSPTQGRRNNWGPAAGRELHVTQCPMDPQWSMVTQHKKHEAAQTTKILQIQIVEALRLGDRTKASDMLSQLICGNPSLQADDLVYILDYCAISPDPSFAVETWRLSNESKNSLNDRCYLLMIQALCKGGYLMEGFNLLSYLEENHGVTPFLAMYNCFLRASVKMMNSVDSHIRRQSALYANNCLDLMECRMVGKNEATYLELLKMAVLQENLSAVHHIWNEYSKHYNFSLKSLRKFVWSFSMLRDIKSAYETLQLMVALAHTFSIGKFDGCFHPLKLDIPIPIRCKLSLGTFEKEETEHFGDKADRLAKLCTPACPQSELMCDRTGSLEQKSVPLLKLLRWSFNDVMHGCVQTGNYSLVEQLFQQMQNLGLQPSSHTFAVYIRAVLSERGFVDGVQLLKTMQQRNLKPFDSTLALISVHCSKALELDLAEALLGQISECRHPSPFNVFLVACDAVDQPERAVRILAKMKQIKLQPDIMTYELMFSLFGNVNAPYEAGNLLSQVDVGKRVKTIEMDMAKNGVWHSSLSLKNLIKAIGQEGMIQEMLQRLDIMESRMNMGVDIYNIVLHCLVEAKESSMARDIFKSMKSCGLPLDAATYDIMINCCGDLKCYRSACSLVSMMIHDGFYPETRTYTALMKILLDNENFDEALDLLDQACSDFIKLDVILFNTILRKASQKGRINVLEHVIEQMNEEKIQPNISTCCYVFTAYADHGFHNTAIEALQVLSMRMICQGDITTKELKAEYENFILSEDPDAESSLTPFFRDDDDDLAFVLLNLRWCAIGGSTITWLPEKSPWAQRLFTNYHTRKKLAR